MDNQKKEHLLSANDVIFVACVAIATILTTVFIASPVKVHGQSMENNYHDGEIYIMEQVSYYFDTPKRFDVVVFPENRELLIKRIIGLPGETVTIDTKGNIYINGEVLKEDYGAEIITPFRDDGEENLGIAAEGYTLKADEYFVLGDNRNHSKDSRFIGPVNLSQIKGKVWVKIL